MCRGRGEGFLDRAKTPCLMHTLTKVHIYDILFACLPIPTFPTFPTFCLPPRLFQLSTTFGLPHSLAPNPSSLNNRFPTLLRQWGPEIASFHSRKASFDSQKKTYIPASLACPPPLLSSFLVGSYPARFLTFVAADRQDIPANDPYWLSFWELPESVDDVFTLFSAADIRRARDNHRPNLETLILALTSRLFALRNHASFPNDSAPERHALNCIRILTRLMPFIYESEQLDAWENQFFWGARRRRVRRSLTDMLFDDNDADATVVETEGGYEDAPPLMEELVDCLIDLLFYQGFTLPPAASGTAALTRVSYAIWQSGVGCNAPVGTTREGENNKIEILRLLLAITSKAMFMPASVLPVKGVKVLTYMVTYPDKRVVLSMLCSLLNTTLKYNPASWRVPYDHVVFTDPRQVLVTYSLQLLLVLLLYPVPETPGSVMKNNYRHYLGRLHRTQDFQFCVDGMTRILNQPVGIRALQIACGC